MVLRENIEMAGALAILRIGCTSQVGGFNPLNAELNPICHLLALLGAHHILHVSRVRVKCRPMLKTQGL